MLDGKSGSFCNCTTIISIDSLIGIDGYKLTTSYDTCISSFSISQFSASSLKDVEFLILMSYLVKDVVLNLCNDELPPHHKDLLELGSKFVPNPTSIPYMDIITTTECSALLLQCNKQTTESEKYDKTF